MTDVFIAVLNRAASASMIILAVMILRLIFRGSPRWILRPFWFLAAFALINYIPIFSVSSLLPTAELVPKDIISDYRPEIDSGFEMIDRGVNGLLASVATGSADPINPIEIAFQVASVIWIVGFIAILIYGLVGYARLRLSVRASIVLEDNVYQCDDIDTPFILGTFKPRIYVPSGMEGKTLEYVLLHERSHIKRGDHICKPFAFLILAFYWFHPLVWLGYVFFCRDVELVCDSYAVDNMTPEGRRDYAETLALFSSRRGFFTVSSLAFGEIAVKNRVKQVLRYGIPDFWESFAAIIVLLVVGFTMIPTPLSHEHIYWSVRKQTDHSYTSRRVDIPFYIPRSVIPEELSTLEYVAGKYDREEHYKEYKFKRNEYIAYEGDNTTIYLKKIYTNVQWGLDPEYYVNFVFEIDPDLSMDGGAFLSMFAPDYSPIALGNGPTWAADLTDANATYDDAFVLVGEAIDDREYIVFSIPLAKLLATEGDLSFVYDLERYTYNRK